MLKSLYGWRSLLGALALSGLAACSKPPEPVAFIAEGRPAKLSDWHVLRADGGKLKLNTGVMPYELNTPLFSDHAHKLRTVWMPQGQRAKFSELEVFDLPVGTIISKTFYYPKGEGQTLLQTHSDSSAELKDGALDLSRVRLVETRILVRRADGWAALPYVWNAEQTEAELARTGDQLQLTLQDAAGKRQSFPYVVPNENQCASCHMVKLKSKEVQPIGLKARHLNRDFVYQGSSENQLAHMVKAGYLGGLPEDLAGVQKAANWLDKTQPLEARARAYLDINCAHCHNPRGPASNTALNLEPFLAPDRHLGLCKPPVAAGKGTGDRLFGIVPGKPDESIMSFRLASQEGGVMMPELGRSTVHEEGMQLIREWIAALPGRCNEATH
ncbi:SO2930 family diheme c-type cytochrome [Roseateles violae]|uniref:SO2930 family diheme c-type cytochrome n=1 Tax=Roseateles violae TaxID=3058042 RepID=A0ABT8DZ67_9BURK|nr:SO2930 family diheme c-type cytochrome [Pelomonas sp. PFR6]MDN3922896.1 SO2930 family diheme c-type cytochrome [Pelomonas sp. PFR6]